MIFKDARAIQWGTENLFTKWCCNNGTLTWGEKKKKKKERNQPLHHAQTSKINFRWIRVINVETKL